MTPQSYYRCWAEIDLDALRHNVSAIRRQIGDGIKLIAVVKADAYGHGMPQVASVLMRSGVDGFAVATLSEALTLRHLGGNGWPILLFGSAFPFEVSKIVEQEITPTLSTLEEAKWFNEAAQANKKIISVQIEIDTGMGRVGFWHETAVKRLLEIASLPYIKIEGAYTHFPTADENLEETQRELGHFLRVAKEAELQGVKIPILHTANSAALYNLSETWLNAVRPGLLLYGVYPGPQTHHRDIPVPNLELHPALSFKARVALVKEVTPGRTISYGQTFVARKPMKIATISVGYADGFGRNLSNAAQVLVGGQRCAVLGRVTMDQIMVDVTPLPAINTGDEVVLVGRQGNEEISVTEVARWAGTISWEILCGITKSDRTPRIYRGISAA